MGRDLLGPTFALAQPSTLDRNGGSYRLPCRPWRFSCEKLEPLGDPAFQGEHNRAVFGRLGLSEDEIEGYIAGGALVSVGLPVTIADGMAKVSRASLSTTTF